MGNEDYDENNESINSSSTGFSHQGNVHSAASSNQNYEFGHSLNIGALRKNANARITVGKGKAKSSPFIVKPNKIEYTSTINVEPKRTAAPIPPERADTDVLSKLKDSTKKLICLLEEIQCKTHSNNVDANRITELITPTPIPNNPVASVCDIIGAAALKKLENQTKTMDEIYVEEEEDDCSIYKRLTRKCNCLNQHEYNDFIIQFNEDTKYFTSNTGEIIKNMRILKKFLYMGGDYSRHALMFLNEGLSDCSHTEKVEIIQGCAYADICNIFEVHSIVDICISWPCKYANCGNSQTQALTSGLLYKLAQLEEGRRYLKFTSKITNDLKKVIRKRASKLEYDTLESLDATLNLMHPQLTDERHLNVSYYCKPADEGFGSKTLTELVQYREYMTLDEVFTHLDLLNKLSTNDNGKRDLTNLLPTVLCLFKTLLMEYNNSEMNIIITNILNNLVSKSMLKPKDLPKTITMADTCTEPILMKNQIVQNPPKSKKTNKSKLGLGSAPNKFRQTSKQKVTGWEQPPEIRLNKSKKFTKDTRNHVIVIPIEE